MLHGLQDRLRLKATSVDIELEKCLKNVLFVCYLVTMLLMSFIRIFDNYFWYDEAFSIDCARMSWSELLAWTAADVHPPLYYMILKLLYLIFGVSGPVSHLSAIIPVFLFVVLSGTYVHRTWGKMTSILLVTACTILPSAVVYNVEVRMYSWACLFVFISFLKVHDILDRQKWNDYMIFMVSSLCAAYLHYYALVAVGFLYIFLIVISIQNKKLIKILVISGGTVLAYLPWLYQFMKTLSRTTDDWWMTELPTVKGCLVFLFGNIELVILFGVLVIIYLIKEQSGKVWKLPLECSHECLWMLSGLFSCTGTIVLGMMMSYGIRPLFEPRYIYVFIAVLWLIFGLCLSKLPYKHITASILVCYLFYCFFIPYYTSHVEEQNRDQALESFVNEVSIRENGGIITTHTYLQTTIDYYYPETTILYAPDGHGIRDVIQSNKDLRLFLFIPSNVAETVLQELEQESHQQELEFIGEVIISHTALQVYELE